MDDTQPTSGYGNNGVPQQAVPHRRRLERTIDAFSASPLLKVLQPALLSVLTAVVTMAWQHLAAINADVREIKAAQYEQKHLAQITDQKVQIEIAALKEYRTQAEARGNLTRDRISQIEITLKVLEDRLNRRPPQQP